MSGKIYLVCGYRRTGKDSFYSIMSGQRLDKRFKWKIYGKSLNVAPLVPINGCKQISFAEKLKQEASEIYGIPSFVSDDDKDIKQFRHYKTGEIVSARDIYIEWGAIRRSQDPDYWCKTAFTQYNKSDTVIVTDWRFPNESKYIFDNFSNVTTLRLYRSDIQEPPIDVSSEHSLDNIITDLLLVRSDVLNEIDKAVEKFPQYKDYVEIGEL